MIQTIFLDKLRVQASVGILEHEFAAKQPLLISLSVNLNPLHIVPPRDDVRSVLDYRQLRNVVLDEINGGHIHMLETLAGRIAQRLLQAYETVERVSVRVDKPSIFNDCDSVAVQICASRSDLP